MNTIDFQHLATPFGELIIGSYGEEICLCDWSDRVNAEKVNKRIENRLDATLKKGSSKAIDSCIEELNQYFELERKEFTSPTLFTGTDFQNKVWEQLKSIKYGTTNSYAEVAISIGAPNSVRAIANANGQNALAIIIPCHRIIGSNNKLTGYSGGISTKKALLQHEGIIKNQLSLF